MPHVARPELGSRLFSDRSDDVVSWINTRMRSVVAVREATGTLRKVVADLDSLDLSEQVAHFRFCSGKHSCKQFNFCQY
jgi:hypothetical protein